MWLLFVVVIVVFTILMTNTVHCTITDYVVSQQIKCNRPVPAIPPEHTAEELYNILIQLESLKWYQLTDLLITIVTNLRAK